MNIHELRNSVRREIIDYFQIKDILKEYAYPRSKISEWLKNNQLIRVKKGLYVFGESAWFYNLKLFWVSKWLFYVHPWHAD